METKHQKKKAHRVCSSNLVVIGIILLALALTSLTTIYGLKKNRNTHAQDEIKSIAKAQVKLLKIRIEDQYGPLKTLANYIETQGIQFGEEELESIATVMTSVHRLCTIAYADKDGNTVDYHGEEMSNRDDRDYFTEVISGRSDTYCSYLATTKSLNEPRVMFSVPVYKKGEIVGIIFCSKEINILESSLFLDSFFDETASSFIANTQGQVIASNQGADAEQLNRQLLQNCGADSEEECGIQKIIQNISDTGASEWHSDAANGTYISCTPIGLNDWYLFNIVDQQAVSLQYRQSEQALFNLIRVLTVVLFLTITFIVVVLSIRQKKAEIEARSFRNQYESYKALLYEMNCTIVEYDAVNDQIRPNRIFSGMQKNHKKISFADLIETLKQTHPEFSVNELVTQKQAAVRECRATVFESIFSAEAEEIRWYKVVLLPIQDMSGKVTEIYAAVWDTTEYHKEFEDAIRFMERVPGGMHRCYLSEPIHLEYVSDGLGKMLGYKDIEEFKAVVGTKYSIAIAEEDRMIFRNFVHELAEEEGTKTCEYRMICKDGSLISVSDTMESRRNVDGIMYGYSAVTNLNEYKKKQEEMEQELSKTKAELMEARIKNANSQMQPHFLYNALASIREIVLDDPEYASDLIFDFSTHLRACIRSMSNDNLVSFSQELENIKAYINIEQMRFGNKLKVVYDIQADQFEIIPLGLQPLVENAVRHGIYERGRAGGTVYIKTYADDDGWVVQIADDGVGFDIKEIWRQIEDGSRDSTGLRNLVLRFEKQMNAKVDIRSEIGVGTKVTISIPGGVCEGGESKYESNHC